MLSIRFKSQLNGALQFLHAVMISESLNYDSFFTYVSSL